MAFTIPRLYCPLSVPDEHPDLDLMEKRGLDWIASRGLASDPVTHRLVANSQSHALLSRLTPSAPAPLVQLGVDLGYLLFTLDDLRTDTGPTSIDTGLLMAWLYDFTYALAVPDAFLPDADPGCSAIAELSRRIRAVTPPEIWHRLIDVLHQSCWSAMWESTQRNLKLTPTFDTYLTARPRFGAAPATLLMAEIAAQLRVPEHEREHPLIRTAFDVSCLLLCLDDDLYSYPKEQWALDKAGRDAAHEPAAIPILMREHNVGVHEAAALLADIRDRLTLLLTRLLTLIKAAPFSPDTMAYVNIAASAVPVGLAWAQECPRFTDPDGRSPGLIELHWAGIHDIPPGNQDPLPYPSIESWWRHAAQPE
ncbi:terpene synthase family protein [Streptomyces lavendulae]|uniref:terpene synthase family protein n=1 Tax=Streptomyces lavendulae TaxID=1914 RepID=UPI0033F055A9